MKKILVTGISRSLGRATAELLVKNGYFVYGTYNKHKDEAIELKGVLKNIEIYQVDLSDHDSIQKFVANLDDVKLDGLVNNAGVFLDIDFDNFDRKSFEKTFMINTFAPLYLAEGLKDKFNNGASIVNIASNDAMVGSIVGIAYSSSKAALMNITQSLANILAPKVRVNAVAPGWMGSGMDAPEDLLKIAAEYNPLNRAGSYNEIAEVVTFLISDKSSYINGTTITVDGGDMATNYILQREAEF